MDIEPFNLRPVCPKCKQDRFFRVWRDNDPKLGGSGEGNHYLSGYPEHLSLRCEACGYSFLMQPADHEGKPNDR